jgi:N-formylglutamate deformylase
MQTFILHDAERAAVPVIASIAHSGVFVPAEIASKFSSQHRLWLRDTDWFLPEVYAFLPQLGIATLEATHSRYVADLNRDPGRALFGRFFDAVVAEHTADGAPVYDQRPDPTDLDTRIARFHEPYHRELGRLLAERAALFSRALLIDLHSYMVPVDHEICLGDGRGSTCAPATTSSFERAFRGEGFDVVTNDPYTGGFVVRSHARTPGVSALQIELRYPVYMDCTLIDTPVRPSVDPLHVARVQPRLRRAIEGAVAAFLQSRPEAP